MDAASRLVGAAIAGIEEHAVSNGRVGDLAASLGVTDRHLRRVTEAELGVSPVELAQTQKLLLAKRLLGETSLKLTDIAFASGFGSVRRFNALFKSRYGLNPRTLRRTATATRGLDLPAGLQAAAGLGRHARVPEARAVPGVEWVDATHYRRTVAIGDARGWIAVSLAKSGPALEVEVSPALAPVIGAVIVRVKHLFDLGAAPDAVSALLSQDPLLAPAVKRLPGLRVPGAFDGFELAVRAVLGQQVSVKAATTMAGRWAKAFGEPIATPWPELSRLAPTAPRMLEVAEHEIGALGVVGSRARCLMALARAVTERRVVLSVAANVEEQIRNLMELPGHRSLDGTVHRHAGAALARRLSRRDLMLLRAARIKRKELLARAEGWRPWRAYATHYLWRTLGVYP